MNDDPKGVKGSNYREVAVTPDGRIFKPQGKDVYVDLPKGTEIFKDYNAFNESGFNKSLDSILMSNEINYAQPNVVVNSGGITPEQMNRLASIVESIPQPILNLDKNGWKSSVRNGHTTKEILNNQVTFGR